MAKNNTRKIKKSNLQETDSTYLLKLVLYLIVGSQWIRVTSGDNEIPIPLGLIIGLLFTMHERFQIDRKIEYAVLLIATFIGFWLPIGIQLVVN